MDCSAIPQVLIERPLLTSDELKSIPKGEFIVMKTGSHPMRTKLQLFLDWGITFKEPYIVPKRKDCTVVYASRIELRKSILEKYPPPEIEESSARPAKSGKRGSGAGGPAVGLQQGMGGVRV